MITIADTDDVNENFQIFEGFWKWRSFGEIVRYWEKKDKPYPIGLILAPHEERNGIKGMFLKCREDSQYAEKIKVRKKSDGWLEWKSLEQKRFPEETEIDLLGKTGGLLWRDD